MKTLLKYLPILLLLVCLSCTKEYVPPGIEPGMVEYTVYQGENYANRIPVGIFKAEVMSKRFNLQNSYTLAGEDAYDINKCFGFSDNPLNPHINSIRAGWRSVPGKDSVDIFLYVWKNKERIEDERFIRIALKKTYRIETGIRNGLSFVTVQAWDMPPKTITGVPMKMSKTKYKLGFHFGGTSSAPQRVTALIDLI